MRFLHGHPAQAPVIHDWTVETSTAPTKTAAGFPAAVLLYCNTAWACLDAFLNAERGEALVLEVLAQ